jgi:type III pantothenate kinase
MQVGLYYGTVDMIDGLLSRMKKELGAPAKVIATGGFAALLAGGSKHIEHTDEFLTLEGLRIIWERNQTRGQDRAGAPKKTASFPGPSKT